VLKPLREGFFSIEEINAEDNNNLADIHAYVEARCQRQPLAAILSRAGLSARDTATVLQAKSGGKFLYAVRVLNDITSSALQLQNRQSLDALPPGMDGFYADTFQRRFPDAGDYDAVKPLMALLCEQREPLGFQTLAAILGCSVRNVSAALQPLNDLLRLVPVPASEGSVRPDVLCSFDHLSLEQWLSEENEFFQPRACRFGVDREEAKQKIRTWALAEVKANRAHISSYLVRHLASQLSDDERAEVIAGQLRQFPWLQARLRLAGLNALLSDFDTPTDRQASLPPELQRLGRALRQAAHVLSHQEGWDGQKQLASQLLARLANDGALEDLRKQTAGWLQKAGSAPPRAASLLAPEALLRTLPVGGQVNALAALPDGRLACGCNDGSIRLWDPASGSCSAIFEGHQYAVMALAVLADGRLASGSDDQTIRLWDPASGSCSAILQGHQGGVMALAVLGDGRLASGSRDATHPPLGSTPPRWRSPRALRGRCRHHRPGLGAHPPAPGGRRCQRPAALAGDGALEALTPWGPPPSARWCSSTCCRCSPAPCSCRAPAPRPRSGRRWRNGAASRSRSSPARPLPGASRSPATSPLPGPLLAR
jgi:hypothetical protein